MSPNDSNPEIEMTDSVHEPRPTSNTGYVPIEFRGQGFKESVLEWLEVQERAILNDPRAEAISDRAIRAGVQKAGLKGVARFVVVQALDWIMPDAGVKLLFAAVRYILKALP